MKNNVEASSNVDRQELYANNFFYRFRDSRFNKIVIVVYLILTVIELMVMPSVNKYNKDITSTNFWYVLAINGGGVIGWFYLSFFAKKGYALYRGFKGEIKQSDLEVRTGMKAVFYLLVFVVELVVLAFVF